MRKRYMCDADHRHRVESAFLLLIGRVKALLRMANSVRDCLDSLDEQLADGASQREAAVGQDSADESEVSA